MVCLFQVSNKYIHSFDIFLQKKIPSVKVFNSVNVLNLLFVMFNEIKIRRSFKLNYKESACIMINMGVLNGFPLSHSRHLGHQRDCQKFEYSWLKT
jgi:hypothetical protein